MAYKTRPISLGQIWILRKMMQGGPPHMICTNMSTTGSPEPIGMPALRGLERRGYCSEGRHAFFTITPAGERIYAEEEPRLVEFERKRQAAIEEAYRRDEEEEEEEEQSSS